MSEEISLARCPSCAQLFTICQCPYEEIIKAKLKEIRARKKKQEQDER